MVLSHLHFVTGFKASIMVKYNFCACVCVYVHGVFKADPVEQTEPGHRRIGRERGRCRDSLRHERKGHATRMQEEGASHGKGRRKEKKERTGKDVQQNQTNDQAKLRKSRMTSCSRGK